VLRHASDLVGPVIGGATGLEEAYAVAQENKTKANSVEIRLTGSSRAGLGRVDSSRAGTRPRADLRGDGWER